MEHFGGSPDPISRGASPPDLSGNLYPCTYDAFFRFLTLRNLTFFVFSVSQLLIPKFLIRLLGCKLTQGSQVDPAGGRLEAAFLICVLTSVIKGGVGEGVRSVNARVLTVVVTAVGM